MAVEVIKRSEENLVRPVTREREDGDLKMRDKDVTPELVGLKASQHATLAGSENTASINVYTTT